MRRLNVRFTQIEECIRKSLFAVDSLPRNPPLVRGERLLLQLVKADAEQVGKLASRIEFALVFDRVIDDSSGRLSREHWPNAGKTWRYVLECRETVAAVPFSLENLGLSNEYAGQSQCVPIAAADEAVITNYFELKADALVERPPAPAESLLQAIRNYDWVVSLAPPHISRVSEHSRRVNNPWLGDILKRLYRHRCQVCSHDFAPKYGKPHADNRFIQSVASGGSLRSDNRLVVCPNHNAIIAVAKPEFDRRTLAFHFPNGLSEPLLLRDHLLPEGEIVGKWYR